VDCTHAAAVAWKQQDPNVGNSRVAEWVEPLSSHQSQQTVIPRKKINKLNNNNNNYYYHYYYYFVTVYPISRFMRYYDAAKMISGLNDFTSAVLQIGRDNVLPVFACLSVKKLDKRHG